MKPKDILLQWIDAFNEADAEKIANLYVDNATNHQVANAPVIGKLAIKEMFKKEFAAAKMVCIPDNIFEDGEWAILEWHDPLGLRGCGFFQIIADKIVFQRGYWDKLSFLKQHSEYTKTELDEAIKALASTLSKCEKAYTKLKQGSPQATLTERRIKAIKIALSLIEERLN